MAQLKSLRNLGVRLGIINDDPRKGPVRFKAVYPKSSPMKPQGLRERSRRVRQIIQGILPFTQLGRKREDALGEYRLAQKNYAPGRRWAP